MIDHKLPSAEEMAALNSIDADALFAGAEDAAIGEFAEVAATARQIAPRQQESSPKRKGLRPLVGLVDVYFTAAAATAPWDVQGAGEMLIDVPAFRVSADRARQLLERLGPPGEFFDFELGERLLTALTGCQPRMGRKRT